MILDQMNWYQMKAHIGLLSYHGLIMHSFQDTPIKNMTCIFPFKVTLGQRE